MTTIYSAVTAPRKDSRTWDAEHFTFDDLISRAENPADHKECGNYLMGTLNGRRRTKSTIVSRSMIQLDLDHANSMTWVDLGSLGVQMLVHTTFSSAPDGLRLRAVIPLDREVTPDEYTHIAAVIMDQVGVEQFDPGSVQPERYMFWPSVHPDHRDWYRYEVYGTEPLRADEWLAEFRDDLSAAPAPRPSKNKRDPLQIDGVVGAFNRAYTIDEVIEAYSIPYEKETEGRWHLIGARAGAGVHAVTDDLVYSHHANDPAYGQTLSAFDLMRVHLYGLLDEDAAEATPVNRLPSTEAAIKRASEDARVVQELVGEDFTVDPDDPSAPSKAWVLGLVRHPKTGEVRDVVANWDLITSNDPVFSSLSWDELELSVKLTAAPPWRTLDREGPIFSLADTAALSLHLEREYGIRPPRYLLEDLIAVTSRKNIVNPVRDYLDSLQWDGVPRVEEALPGVRPTDYTRMVARKSLVSAVARMYDPGVKWDHSLIIYGAEGRGKTFWINRMSRGWTSTLGDIHSKDTLMTLQRSWIVTSDEGFSMRKSDADALKEFLTRTHDTIRLPYERQVQLYPRHCVIWGTTNDPTFLRRQQGNRRYLIVHAEDRVDFDQLTDDYVNQVWAEAVQLYRDGEPLFIDERDSAVAAEEREQYTEDSLTGVIQEWLNTPVPDTWEDMSISERLTYLDEQAEGLGPVGTNRINQVCSTQLWVECLRRPIGDRRRLELTELANELHNLPGWRPRPGRHRLKNYGTQLVFERIQ